MTDEDLIADDRFPLRLCVKCFAPYRALFCMNCLESNEYAQGQLDGWNAARKLAEKEITKKDAEIIALKEVVAVLKESNKSHLGFMASMFRR